MRRSRADERLWQVQICSFADSPKSARNSLMQSIERSGSSLFESTQFDYSKYPDDVRVRLLGSNLATDAEWLESHPDERRWLSDQGLTSRDAIDAYHDWVNQEWTNAKHENQAEV